MSEESNESGRRPSILDAFIKEAEEKKAEEAAQAEAEQSAAGTAETAGERAIPDSADDEGDDSLNAAASLVRPAAAVSDEQGGNAEKDKQDALDALDSLLAQRGTHTVEDSPTADPRLADRVTVVMDAVEDGEEQGEGEALEEPDDEAAEGQEEADEFGQTPAKRNPAKIAMFVIGGVAAAAILVLIGTSLGTLAAQQAVEARNIESTQTVTNSSSHEQSADSNAQKAEDATLAPAQDGASGTAANGTAQAVCEHDWQPEAETKHHDAVTKEITIPGSTYTETEYHTLCNVCNEQIDGKTAEHKAQTGHVGYTTNVPIKVTKKSPDTTSTVEVEAAYDEKVWTKEKCSKCGAEREVGEHSEKVE